MEDIALVEELNRLRMLQNDQRTAERLCVFDFRMSFKLSIA